MATVPPLRLVPSPASDVVWAAEQPKPADAPEAFWVPLAKRWWPVAVVPGILLVASYWGPPRGPLFR